MTVKPQTMDANVSKKLSAAISKIYPAHEHTELVPMIDQPTLVAYSGDRDRSFWRS